jgi:hypothetical protein
VSEVRAPLRSQPDVEARIFVGLVWLAQSYLLFDFVSTFGLNIPWFDEWEMIPALTGAQEITLEWLWSQHNEHRIPLARLVYLLVERLAGYDFRAGMYFDVGLLSIAALGCIVAVRRLRGSTSYADAFFPLLLLHCGQSQNLETSFQIAFVLSAAITLAALQLMATRDSLSFPAALGLGVCTVALPLTGGAGLAMVPALGVCTLLSAWDLRRLRPHRRAEWLVVLATACLGFALMVLYFVGYERPAKHPVSPSLSATAEAALQVLTTGFGSGTVVYWHSGSGYVVVVLSLATAAILAICLIGATGTRGAARRLGLFLAGMLCLAGGLAWARAALRPGALFDSRYVTLTAPFLCGTYFSWALVKQKRLGQFVQMTLFLLTALLVVRNREQGYAESALMRATRLHVLSDIRAGVPRAEIFRRHCTTLYYVCNTSALSDRMRMLRDKGAGDFAYLRE